MSNESVCFARFSGEKKIVSLPPLRVDEGMRSDLQGLAEIKGITESELMRIAITRLIDEEMATYHGLHSIFAGRERRCNQSHVEQRIAADDEQ